MQTTMSTKQAGPTQTNIIVSLIVYIYYCIITFSRRAKLSGSKVWLTYTSHESKVLNTGLISAPPIRPRLMALYKCALIDWLISHSQGLPSNAGDLCVHCAFYHAVCTCSWQRIGKGKGSSLDIALLQYWTAALYNLGSGSWLALTVVLRRKLVAAYSLC